MSSLNNDFLILSISFLLVLVLVWLGYRRLSQELSNAKDELATTQNELNLTQEALALTQNDFEQAKQKFSRILDIETECQRLEQEEKKVRLDNNARAQRDLAEIERRKESTRKEIETLRDRVGNIKKSYQTKKEIYDSLVRQIAIFSDEIELIELGFYEPHFEFDTSESFKIEIKACKARQKALLRDKTSSGAIYCSREWSVDGSRAEGKKMTNQAIRIAAKAFNNECEAAIANCTWKNVQKMRERIRKAFDDVNKLNSSNRIYITSPYLDEKLNELELTYEYKEKKQREKEEQAEIRAQMREEAKIEAEIKKAEQDAIKEEKRYQKALDNARKELEKAGELDKIALEAKIENLQKALSEAEEKHQRARSMAEQTKQGHVYVISNIGSFGDEIYKIGMTRRIEPMERVKELGDASVPFTFDVHAMIHTDDAPSLEKKLHEQFDTKRVNLVNRRKEFFNVSLLEVKEAVLQLCGHSVEFIETAIAQDYNESRAKREYLSATRQGSLNDIPKGASIGRQIPKFADSI